MRVKDMTKRQQEAHERVKAAFRDIGLTKSEVKQGRVVGRQHEPGWELKYSCEGEVRYEVSPRTGSVAYQWSEDEKFLRLLDAVEERLTEEFGDEAISHPDRLLVDEPDERTFYIDLDVAEMRERIVNESFSYDPIQAAVNATRMNAETDGGSTHLDLRKKDVADFIARYTEATEADALTAIENAVEDGFLTETEAGTVHTPYEA